MASSSPPQVVVFDLVGTLIYPFPDVATIYSDRGRRFGATLSRATIARRFPFAWQASDWSQASHEDQRRAWQNVVSTVFSEIPDTDSLFEDLWEHFAQPTTWRVFDDVFPVWQRLVDEGFPLVIGSNFDLRIGSICKGLGLADHCTHVFGSAQIGAAKPHRAFFDQIARQLQIAPDRLLMIGDDLAKDVHGALNAGWQAVYLARESAATALPLPSNIKVIKSLGGLLAGLP